MRQVYSYISGERDYTLIKRLYWAVGPILPPCLYLHRPLLPHGPRANILSGQILFALLYILTLAVVVACYARSGSPPYLLPLLILSNAFIASCLRLFNDGFAAFAMWTAIPSFRGENGPLRFILVYGCCDQDDLIASCAGYCGCASFKSASVGMYPLGTIASSYRYAELQFY